MSASLDRFIAAQAGTHATAETEIAAGRKVSHWMWFVFPQLAILSRSETARLYGIAGLAEAAAYLSHPVLGPRLEMMSRLMLTHRGTRAEDILGSVDAMKLRSAMTLFAAVPGASPVFAEVLDAFYGGVRCPLTRNALAQD